jgi:Rod binding domain-containing protein
VDPVVSPLAATGRLSGGRAPDGPAASPASRAPGGHAVTDARAAQTGQGVEEAAQGFEAIFMRQLLHDLRKTTSIDGQSSYTAGFYNDMFDDFLAEHLAKAGGLGLGGVIRAYAERGAR